jgi:hypothetical protein
MLMIRRYTDAGLAMVIKQRSGAGMVMILPPTYPTFSVTLLSLHCRRISCHTDFFCRHYKMEELFCSYTTPQLNGRGFLHPRL